MIEINLLPPEYRHVERAPMAALLGVVFALAILGGLGFYYILMLSETENMRITSKQRADHLKQVELAAKEVDRLEAEKVAAEQRLNYIKALARRRLPWGLKLTQFQNIVAEARDIQVTRLSLQTFGQTYKLVVDVTIRGEAGSHTEMLNHFYNDHSFMHHFEESPATDTVVDAKEKIVKTKFEFSVRTLSR